MNHLRLVIFSLFFTSSYSLHASCREPHLFYEAVYSDNIAQILTLIERGEDVNKQDCEGNTALHFAVGNENPEVLKLILSANADVMVENNRGELPISWGLGDSNTLALLAHLYDAEVVSEKLLLTEIQSVTLTGDLPRLGFLLSNGQDPNDSENDNSFTPLMLASMTGNANAVELLLAFFADVSKRDVYERTALHYAAKNKFAPKELVEQLLEAGADPGQSDGRELPIHAAARLGNAETIQQLFQAGSSLDATDWIYFTPLRAAAANDNVETLKMLLALGARSQVEDALVDAATEGRKATLFVLLEMVEEVPSEALLGATCKGHLENVEMLLKKGADPSGMAQFTSYEWSGDRSSAPLHCAVKNPESIQKEIMSVLAELLISYGATLDQKDGNERTPLYLAVNGKDFDMMNLLLKAGADPNLATREASILQIAAEKFEGALLSQVVTDLLAYGMRLDAQDDQGFSTVYYFLTHGHHEQAARLIREGALLQEKDFKDMPPVIWSVENDKIEILNALADVGVSLDAKNTLGQSALHLATRTEALSMMQALLSRGAKVDIIDKLSRTPLGWAAYEQKLKAAKILLSAGADKNKADFFGKSPLHWAQASANQELIALFEEFK